MLRDWMSILLTLFAARSAVAKPNHAFFHCQQPRRKIFTPDTSDALRRSEENVSFTGFLAPPKGFRSAFVMSCALGTASAAWTEIAMTCALAVFVPLLAWIMIDAGRLWVGSMLRRKEPDYAVTGEDARDIRSRDRTVRQR